MNQDEIVSALRRGGMFSSSAPGRYDPLLDPGGAETLGHLLAEAARSGNANTVLVWSEAADAVLGFIVARRLGVPVVRLVDDDGLLEVHGEIVPSTRAALVTDVARRDRVATAIAAVTRQGGELVIAGALVADRDPAPAVPIAALVEIDPTEGDDASDAG